MASLVSAFIYALGIYLLIGLIFSIVIQWKGLKQMDSAVEGAGFWFRVFIFPGCCSMWPFLIKPWLKTLKK